MRQCGRHKCATKCCIDLNHMCMLICGQTLKCGLHKCEEVCHRGNCPRLVKIFYTKFWFFLVGPPQAFVVLWIYIIVFFRSHIIWLITIWLFECFYRIMWVIPTTKYRKMQIMKNQEKFLMFFHSHLGIMAFLQILAIV